MVNKQAKHEQNQERIRQLVKDIEQQPNDTTSYLELSALLLEQKAFTEAIELLQKAHALVAKPELLDFNLAVAYYYDGQYDAALSILAQLPVEDTVLYQQALIFFKQGNIKKALAFVLTIKKVTDESQELLGDIWLALGATKQAKEALMQIPVAARSAKVWFMLGVTSSTNSKDSAEGYFAKSRELDSEYFTTAMKQYEGVLALVREKNDD